MKLLLLEPTHRRWLNSKSALEIDANLDEMFVGLTHAESVVYAVRTTPPFTPFDQWNVHELLQILGLHSKHELALAVKVIPYGITFQ